MGSFVDGIIINAEKLSQLSATAIWALFTLVMVLYIAWDMRSQSESRRLSLEMRIKDAESDILISKALERVVDELRDLRRGIKCVGGNDD